MFKCKRDTFQLKLRPFKLLNFRVQKNFDVGHALMEVILIQVNGSGPHRWYQSYGGPHKHNRLLILSFLNKGF